MNKKRLLIAGFIGLVTTLVLFDHTRKRNLQPTPQSGATSLTGLEQPLTPLPLTGPLAAADSEVSGLAWYGDTLILLPQYPDRLGNQIFSLPKADILAFLEGKTAGPLEPKPIPFEDSALGQSIDGFEGYEAIAFSGNRAFLTIEAERGAAERGATETGEAETDSTMMGYLTAGTLAEDLSQLTIDPTQIAEIPPQSTSPNKADEALVIANNQILSIYEVNGKPLNLEPKVHAFDVDLQPQTPLSFPGIAYRLTDATAVDEANRFWAINYFYPGDRDLLPEKEPLAERYGKGTTHQQQETVERLVEFAYTPTGIELTDTAPIQLELDQEARNWEGIVYLDEQGFLLVTDKFPNTLLGFIEKP